MGESRLSRVPGARRLPRRHSGDIPSHSRLPDSAPYLLRLASHPPRDPPRPSPPLPPRAAPAPARRSTSAPGLTVTLPAPTSLDTGGKGPGVSWTPRPGRQAQAAAQGRGSPVTRQRVVHSARVHWGRALTKEDHAEKGTEVSPPDRRPASEQSPSLRTATAAAVAATR